MRILSQDYRFVPGYDRRMPICDLYLIGPRGRVTVRALVDSGATYSVFPIKAAEDAGIRLTAGLNLLVQYGGSDVLGRQVPAYLELKGRRFNADVVFVERLNFSFALLGRVGVFAQFNEVVFLEKIKNPRVEFRW